MNIFLKRIYLLNFIHTDKNGPALHDFCDDACKSPHVYGHIVAATAKKHLRSLIPPGEALDLVLLGEVGGGAQVGYFKNPLFKQVINRCT